ncbi:hypothetical protein M8J76_002785 [Diaphorina citri]|nr:hypothetical protein M8J76_002785 [Diaphorina citri]
MTVPRYIRLFYSNVTRALVKTAASGPSHLTDESRPKPTRALVEPAPGPRPYRTLVEPAPGPRPYRTLVEPAPGPRPYRTLVEPAPGPNHAPD